MRRLTLCLRLEGLRADDLRHAPFIASLSSTVAALRAPFGELTDAAYFGGLTPSQSGFTHRYGFDPLRSPFGVARGLPSRLGSGESSARAYVESVARARVRAFASTDVFTHAIPLSVLPLFAPVNQYAPWERGVGYRSLFHELDDEQHEWYAAIAPETRGLGDASDRGIVANALQHVDGRQRFAFVHLQELGAAAQVHGPGSAQAERAVRRLDAYAEMLVSTLDARYDVVDVIAFSDRVAVHVTQTVDIGARLEKTALACGVDYTCFLDSTTARFWYHCGRAVREIHDALASCAGGRWLGADDCARLDIAGCDPRNADEIFVMKPGVAVLPNCLQRTGAELRGASGYDPDAYDSHGVVLCRVAGREPLRSVVTAVELHRYLRERALSHGVAAVAAQSQSMFVEAR